MCFDKAKKELISEIAQLEAKASNFNTVNEKKPFAQGAGFATKGLEEFMKADAALKSGDTIGASAAVLRGIGSVSQLLVFAAGPSGALIGGVLNVLLGVISAIMDALKPPTDSLISKIEKLIQDQILKTKRDDLSAAFNAWKMEEVKMDAYLKAGNIKTWEDAINITNWQNHYTNISNGFATLQTQSSINSREWLPLFDINIIYTLRFWLRLQHITVYLFIRKKPADAESKDMLPLLPTLIGPDAFLKIRNLAAKTLYNALLNVHYSSVNNVDFHSQWLSHLSPPYTSGTGIRGIQREPIYNRIGVAKGPEMKNMSSGESICFAIAESGTIFNVGTFPNTLYIGRQGTDWYQVPTDIFNDHPVEQVAIGEMGDDKLIIVCAYDGGTKISYCTFDDESGTDHENEHNGWTAGDWRCPTAIWKQKIIPEGLSILSLGVHPWQPNWDLYAFAVNKEGAGNLYSVKFASGKTVVMEKIPHTFLGVAQMIEFTFKVAPHYKRKEISPCTISFVGNDLYLQVGNWICQKVDDKWEGWNVRTVLGKEELNVYQARFFADKTQVFATNKGLIMRYNNPKEEDSKGEGPKGERWSVYTDENIQTLCFWKAVSAQAGTAWAMLKTFKEAMDQTIDDLPKNANKPEYTVIA